ncbi:MAG TPA: hypothetical protein VGB73_20990 [Pyrinomonadaceae bacterium]
MISRIRRRIRRSRARCHKALLASKQKAGREPSKDEQAKQPVSNGGTRASSVHDK